MERNFLTAGGKVANCIPWGELNQKDKGQTAVAGSGYSLMYPRTRQGLIEPGEVLPRKRLMGIFGWMGLHFHDWIDYNGVTFLVELLEWGRTFLGFLGWENPGKQGFKNRKLRG